jgi:GNAT superfamily N-acetyltransferase
VRFSYFHTFGAALGRGLAVSHAMERHFPKGIDYWYHCAGVRPEHQGKGWGSAAIREGLTQARSMNLPVYLETAKASNVALYVKLGFKVVGEWDVPKGGPHFWSMFCENLSGADEVPVTTGSTKSPFGHPRPLSRTG